MRLKIMSSDTAIKILTHYMGIATALMTLPITIACELQNDDIANGMPNTTATLSNVTKGNTLAEGLAATDSLDKFLLAIQSANLDGILRSKGPYVVFAPTNKAFAALPKGTLDKLLLPKNKKLLVQILTYHIVPHAFPFNDGPFSYSVPTIQGGNVKLSAYKEPYTDGGEIITDIPHSVEISLPITYRINGVVYHLGNSYRNGSIHVVEAVLIPPTVNLIDILPERRGDYGFKQQ
jgi:uncharacterized surface protein with fasciclin (FAS1) repeats